MPEFQTVAPPSAATPYVESDAMPTDDEIVEYVKYLKTNPNMSMEGEDAATKAAYDPKLKRSKLDEKFYKYALANDPGTLKADLKKGYISRGEFNRNKAVRKFFDENKQPVLDASQKEEAGDLNYDWLSKTRAAMPTGNDDLSRAIRDEVNTRAGNMTVMGAGPTATWRTGKGAGGTWVPTPGGQYLYMTPEGNRYTYDQVMNPEKMDYYKEMQEAKDSGDINTYRAYKAQMDAANPNYNARAAKQSWANQFPDQAMDAAGVPTGVPKYPTRPGGGSGLEGQRSNWSSNWGGASSNNAYGAAGSAGFFGPQSSGTFGGLGNNGQISAPTTGGIYGIPTTGGFSGTPGSTSSFNTSSKGFKKGGVIEGDQKKAYSKLNGCAIKGKTKGKFV